MEKNGSWVSSPQEPFYFYRPAAKGEVKVNNKKNATGRKPMAGAKENGIEIQSQYTPSTPTSQIPCRHQLEIDMLAAESADDLDSWLDCFLEWLETFTPEGQGVQ